MLTSLKRHLRLATLALCSATLLPACAVSVGRHGGVEVSPTPPIEALKPANEDFYGGASSFAGRWEGECTYTRPSGIDASSCFVSVSLTQSSSTLAGSVTYVIDGRSSSFYLPQYYIDGNSIRDAMNRYSGRIGNRAVSVNGDAFGELSLRRMYDGHTGLLIRNLPEDRSYQSGYAVTASLHQTL